MVSTLRKHSNHANANGANLTRQSTIQTKPVKSQTKPGKETKKPEVQRESRGEPNPDLSYNDDVK